MRLSLTAPLARCLLGTVVLATLSTAVLAQSEEYRRGYDQGYRDGAAAGRNGQGRAGYASRIRIDEALYGVRGAACDARGALQQRLASPQGGAVLADNQLCGDPAPGQPKQLTLRYRCADGATQRAVATENSVISLDCR